MVINTLVDNFFEKIFAFCGELWGKSLYLHII